MQKLILVYFSRDACLWQSLSWAQQVWSVGYKQKSMEEHWLVPICPGINLRTNQSLFSLNSRVSRNGTFGTILGVYRSNLSYRSFWSTIISHLLPRKKVLKKIRSLHNGPKSLPLKKLQRQEKIIFGTEIGAIT